MISSTVSPHEFFPRLADKFACQRANGLFQGHSQFSAHNFDIFLSLKLFCST